MIGRLRDLTDKEFFCRYQCDRFTANVLANRFRYVVSHMSNQFRWHAFSPIIRDSADLCGMLSGPPPLGYPMAAVSETVPLFWGSIPDAVRIVLEEYGPERLAPGDTLIVNDCYRVGTHFNDACCIRPVFYDGELVGVVCLRAHLLDIGGSVFGGFSVTSRTTYQNGLRIPPTLLYAGGEPVESAFKLLFDNTRIAALTVPDLQTEYQALAMAEGLLQETIGRYGLDAYYGAMRYACDASDEAMRDALATLPDGVYSGTETLITDGLPDSPEYRVQVRVTKVGERAEFDLRGSAPATRSSINCTWLDIKTAVVMALKLLIEQRHPMTSGALRSIDVIVPPGAIFNPHPPTACQFYFDIVTALTNAIFRALNPVLGRDAVGGGMGSFSVVVDSFSAQADDYPEVTGILSIAGGPWGATRHGDGDSGQQPVYTNLSVTGGVEGAETMFPEGVLIRGEYAADTAGPGTHRGGAANVYDVVARTGMRLEPLLDEPAAGGGADGGGGGVLSTFDRISPGDPEWTDCLFHPLLSRAVSRLRTAGGGGWGDPLARDPEKVLADVRDEYVSISGAARDYGVVVTGDPVRHPEGLRVDVDATAALRAGERPARPPSSGPAEEVPLVPALEPVDGDCPSCGHAGLRSYPVLAAGGWFEVVKCRDCLHSVSRVPWHQLGWVTLAEDMPWS